MTASPVPLAKPGLCPHCGALCEAGIKASLRFLFHASPPPPKAGELSVCQYCRGVVRFAADLSLVKPTTRQLRRAINKNPAIVDEIAKCRTVLAFSERLFGPLPQPSPGPVQ